MKMNSCDETKAEANKFLKMAESVRCVSSRNRELCLGASAQLDDVATYLEGVAASLLHGQAADGIRKVGV